MADDHDRWIKGMQRFRQKIIDEHQFSGENH